MASRERLYERPLTREFDDQARQEIEAEFHRRRHEIPIPVDFSWNKTQSSITIGSKWVSFLIHFVNDRMVVDAELSFTAKMLATEKNRKQVVGLISSVADDLRL